jgi:hypothetical protein
MQRQSQPTGTEGVVGGDATTDPNQMALNDAATEAFLMRMSELVSSAAAAAPATMTQGLGARRGEEAQINSRIYLELKLDLK